MRILTDTSALVKALLREPGWEKALEVLTGADQVLASRFVYPEARSALARALRASRIDRRQHARLVTDLDDRWELIAVVELSAEVARLAGEVADAHGLRGGDAVHLASALILSDREVVVATWDANLARAAVEAGLPVTPPIQ
jgi:predicted nucleic acid-binding protein